jgi:hypothetical protein
LDIDVALSTEELRKIDAMKRCRHLSVALSRKIYDSATSLRL